MHVGIISAIFLGVAANLDNLGIGIAYGIRNIRITFISNLIIGLLSGLTAYLTVLGGIYIKALLGSRITGLLGPLLIMAVGLWMVADYFVKHGTKNAEGKKGDFDADYDHSGDISVFEALSLGAALAINCVATGFSAGLAGLSPLLTGLSVTFFSCVTIPVGIYFGKHCLAVRFKNKAGIAAGLLLVLIATLEFMSPT